jgi:hypothetical protein
MALGEEGSGWVQDGVGGAQGRKFASGGEVVNPAQNELPGLSFGLGAG